MADVKRVKGVPLGTTLKTDLRRVCAVSVGQEELENRFLNQNRG
jgi:hypothetical protein